MGRYNTEIKLVYFDGPENEDDFPLDNLLNNENIPICPIVKTESQLKTMNIENMGSMDKDQIVAFELDKLKGEGKTSGSVDHSLKRMEGFLNKIVTHLKCGFDMPIDHARNLELMPSIYCEVGYSKTKGLQNILSFDRSSTVHGERYPSWNEQLIVPFLHDHLIPPENKRSFQDSLIQPNGELGGFMHISFYDSNKGKNGLISHTEFPLSYFEPFKPLNMQLKIPLEKTQLEKDIDFELDQLQK